MSFQAESKKVGDEFEALVYQDLQRRGFDVIDKDFYLAGTGCEVDFRAHGERFEYVECKGGNEGVGKRPGAKRTDNVKKAIANGALIKSIHDLYYVVYFSAKADVGSYSDEMIKTALKYKIIDEVRYLEQTPEKTISDIIKELKETNPEMFIALEENNG
jgi:hypothetical protein